MFISKLASIMRESRGLSLVEMAIVTVIIGVGVMGTYSLFANVNGTRAGNVALLQAQQNARNIVERIARELRESSPEVVWLSHEGESQYISFFTPRDQQRRFMISDESTPVWQRAIGYGLNRNSNEIYRYQLYLVHEPSIFYDSFSFENVSKDVEELSFSRDNDMITISVRTFYEPEEGSVGHVAKTFAEYHTTVKMRN